MASIRQQKDLYEIRECVPTDKGPRQRALARFRGVLTPEILDAAESNASRPFDRTAVEARARDQGIPVSRRRRHPHARHLLAHLQRGGALEPTLVTLLRGALDALDARPVPEHLADAAEWIGQPDPDRGAALRGLLRSADRVLQSRPALRERARAPFPRFHSRPIEDDAAHLERAS